MVLRSLSESFCVAPSSAVTVVFLSSVFFPVSVSDAWAEPKFKDFPPNASLVFAFVGTPKR